MRTIKEEEVDFSEYQDYWDASWQMGRFLEDASVHKRIHSSLGYLTLVEFESQWLAQQDVSEVVDKKWLFCVQFLGRSTTVVGLGLLTLSHGPHYSLRWDHRVS
jgi:hypothetical protein